MYVMRNINFSDIASKTFQRANHATVINNNEFSNFFLNRNLFIDRHKFSKALSLQININFSL